MKFLTLTKCFVLTAILCCAATFAWSQATTYGQIRGQVTDPTGALVPGATIILKNVNTGATQSIQSNNDGLYEFSFLQPGSYSVEANATGFQKVIHTVTVSLGSAIAMDMKLTLSTASTTIEVAGQAATIETENANLTVNFDASQVSELPNPGNDLTAVAETSPGLVMNTTGGAMFGGGNYEFYGLPSNSNVFTYDGANDNDPYFNVNNSGATNLTLGLNDVQEASVVTNGYSGQYGGLAGADINYVSKSGSNDFHGNAEYFWNGRTLNSNDYFLNQGGTPRPFVNANQYAASFGGPIKKNKAFFFGDYEGIRLFIPSIFSVNVPTQQFESAVDANLTGLGLSASVPFYNNLYSIYAGAPGSSSAQNIVPAGTTSTGAPLNANGCDNIVPTGVFAAFVPGGPACALQYHGGTSQTTNDYLAVGRVDINLFTNDKLFLRAQHESGLQATYTDPLTPTFDAHSQQPEWQAQLSETHTIGNNKVNNFVASFQWYSALFTMVNASAANALQPYTLAIGDGSLFNVNNDGAAFPQGRDVTQYNLVDDFSWVRGKHDIKVGANYRRDDVSDHNFGLITPFVEMLSLNDFANGGTATGNYLSSIAEQYFPVNNDVPVALYQLGWYVSDEWRVKENLSITLSMRFDHLSNPICQTNCFTALSAPFASLNPNNPVNQDIVTGVHTAFPSVTPVVYQPKIGFAWSPGGSKSTVVRGGAGIFSDAIPSLAIDQILDNPPNDPSFVLANLPSANTQPGNILSGLSAANTQFRSNYAAGLPVPAFSFFNGGKVTIPRYFEGDLEVQQAIGNHSTMSVKYVVNHGEYEEMTNPALNAFSPTGAAYANLPLTAPNPNFGTVAQTQNVGNSNYNGLIATFQHKFQGGFQFQAGYTWSHALDEISNNSLNPFGLNSSTNADIVFPINPDNIKQFNYGNADYDVRQSFNMNYVWSNAFRHITSWGPNALMKGWIFSGTLFDHTGFPYTIYSSGLTGALHNANFGSSAAATDTSAPAVLVGLQNPNCGPQAAEINNGTQATCLNSANFADPTAGYGNQRRNQFRGPGYFDTDFNVEKGFNIPRWESAQFTVGARFFNFLNHPNFAFPVTDIDNSSFGHIQTMASQPTTIYGSGLGADAAPRVIEFTGKLVF
jgi:Carboxypeptidase regulatory-like domain